MTSSSISFIIYNWKRKHTLIKWCLKYHEKNIYQHEKTRVYLGIKKNRFGIPVMCHY